MAAGKSLGAYLLALVTEPRNGLLKLVSWQRFSTAIVLIDEQRRGIACLCGGLVRR